MAAYNNTLCDIFTLKEIKRHNIIQNQGIYTKVKKSAQKYSSQ